MTDEFDRFFLESKPALFAQAYVLTGDVAEAEDLVQETLVRTWRHWQRVSRLENPGGWARHVLDNLAVDSWRRRASRNRRAGLELRSTTAVAAPATEPLELVAALRALPEQQRQAVVLSAVVGLTTDEIAEEMSTTAATVRSWLSRARAAVSSELADSPSKPAQAPPGERPEEVK